MPHGESWRIPYAYSPNGIHTVHLAHAATRIHTRGTPTGVHTVDFLIWRIRQMVFIPLISSEPRTLPNLFFKLRTVCATTSVVRYVSEADLSKCSNNLKVHYKTNCHWTRYML